jgi:hypothetical protein
MVIQHIARGGAAQRVVLPRRSFLKGLVSLITAPAVVKAETLMPIVVWKPTFDLSAGNSYVPLLLHCRRDDLIGVDLGSLGLPAPSKIRLDGGQRLTKSVAIGLRVNFRWKACLGIKYESGRGCRGRESF